MMKMMGAMPYSHILFENWNVDRVAEWLRGLDDAILPYVHFFLNNGIDGKKLLLLTHSDLEKLNVTKLGHQELILEAVDLLRALRYGYETENLQFLALQLGCKAKSLHNEIQASSKENDRNKANTIQSYDHSQNRKLSINVLSSVADLITTLKNIVSWFDRAPFEATYDLCLLRNTIVKTGIDLVSLSQKESNIHDLEDMIMKNCMKLSDLCEGLIQNNKDALLIQPASLELATIRKKPGEELGMHIQSAYYGVHVIGGVKDMSPADLCGKIERGDEVIQVNYQTVIGWQLKKLVNTLKEKPKEVILLLKKRPHHISPYGPLTNKKKRLKAGQNIATLPKTLKKRRSREGGDPAKQPRPSLQEFVTNTDDLFSPKEDNRTSDEKDDGNDTDNDVFRSGSESPQYTLPVVVDPKQRRATVCGGSPTLSRPLLVIEDLDTPTRPKSFTVASVDAPQTEYKDPLTALGEETNLVKLGEPNKATTASQKRQEFTVKKPTPIVQEPVSNDPLNVHDNADGLPLTNNFYDKKTLDLLEVPSRFQIPSRKAEEDEEEETEEKVENTEILSSPSSSDTLTDVKTEDVIESKDAVDSVVKLDNKDTESLSDSEVFIDDKPHSSLDIIKQIIDDSKNNNIVEKTTTEGQESVASKQQKDVDIDRESISSAKSISVSSPPYTGEGRLSQTPKAAPRSIDATFVDYQKQKKSAAHSDVAYNTKEKNQPQLVRIRKIESMKASDVDKKTGEVESHSGGRHVTFESTGPKEPEEATSYTTIVVGGVVQKIPVERTHSEDSPTVVRRKQKMNKRVDRRVSCKDLGKGDCEGWMYKDKGKGRKHWLKRWCVLKNFNLFYFKHKEDLRAEGVIHLPAFQVSPAPEIKTKKFAFKVHNAGTSFVFASERQDDMSKWMNKMGLAAITFKDLDDAQIGGFKRPVVKPSTTEYYSESDDDDPESSPKQNSIPNSPESVHQKLSNPSTPELVALRRKHSHDSVVGSSDDLTKMYQAIQQENLTFDGKDRERQRRSRITSVSEMEHKAAAEELETEKAVKVTVLQRTLKAREQELKAIEQLLMANVTPAKLREFKQRHLQQKLDSDSENET